VEHMDDAVGKVLNKLEENGILENTIVIFTSDNGGLRGNYENNRKKVTSNLPLRSGKGDVYEGGVRVPFIVHWPNNILEGQVDNTPITSADIFPTILGLTGVKINDQSAENIDGIDFAPLLTSGDDIHRDAIYWHYPHYHLEGAKPYSAIRKGDWKLIEIFENKELELYNLKEDIGEKNNLRLRYPEKVVELQNDLNTWRQDVKAQLPKTNPQFMEEYESSWKAGQWRNRPDDEFLEHLRKANQ
ncbi:MAG: sulfatase-like hydrolase/transferase, partial [Eudoraea sp.]|nr:sulfatase-like hydrolase/transferase [Eudoraea sp.]